MSTTSSTPTPSRRTTRRTLPTRPAPARLQPTRGDSRSRSSRRDSSACRFRPTSDIVSRMAIGRTLRSPMTGVRGPSSLFLAAAIIVAVSVWVSAQTPQIFQFYISATNADGMPVKDLRPDDVIMSENGVRQTVAKVEPVSVPIKLTIAVDNGLESADAIAHYRVGLKGLVDALPPDVEVTLITTSPPPRMVVKPTAGRADRLRGINASERQSTRPRGGDAITALSHRQQKGQKEK